MEPSEPDAGVLICKSPRWKAWTYFGLFFLNGLFGLIPLVGDAAPKVRADPASWLVLPAGFILMVGAGTFLAVRAARNKVVADRNGLTVVRGFQERFIAWNCITDYFLLAHDGNTTSPRIYILSRGELVHLPAYGQRKAIQAYIEREARWARSRKFELRERSVKVGLAMPVELGYRKGRAAWWKNLFQIPLFSLAVASPFIYGYFRIGPRWFSRQDQGFFWFCVCCIALAGLSWLLHKAGAWCDLQAHQNEHFLVTDEGVTYQADDTAQSFIWSDIVRLETGHIGGSLLLEYWRIHLRQGVLEFTSGLDQAGAFAAYIADEFAALHGLNAGAVWEIDEDTWARFHGVRRKETAAGEITQFSASNFVNRSQLLALGFMGLLIPGLSLWTGIFTSKWNWDEVGWCLIPPALIALGHFLLGRVEVLVTPQGIERHTPFGRGFLAWSEVEQYDSTAAYGHGRRVGLALSIEPKTRAGDRLLREIQTRAPETKRRQAKAPV